MPESLEPADAATRQAAPAGTSPERTAQESPEPSPATADKADGDLGPEDAHAPTAIRRFRTSPRGLAVLGVAIIGIAVGVFLAASSSPRGQSADAKAPGSAANTGQAVGGPVPGGSAQAAGIARTPASQNPAVGLAGFPPRSGPTPLKPSNAARVKSWNTGQGGAVLAQITTTIGAVLMAHATTQYPQMLQECGTLAGMVQKAEALPPIPDSNMQKFYTESLTVFMAGIAECKAGINLHLSGDEDVVTNVSQGVIRQAISNFDKGIAELYIATGTLRKQ